MIIKCSDFREYCNGLFFLFIFFSSQPLFSQSIDGTAPSTVSLSQCIQFALANQPLLGQSKIDEDINKQDIRIALSGWLPQLNVDANLEHNIQLPVVFFPNLSDLNGPKIPLSSGLYNTSGALFSANQVLYSTELFYAGKTSKDLRKLASQNTQNVQINTIVDVSKAFYDVLLTGQQLNILDEDIQRLARNYEDAFSLYQNGLTDKTDYQRASIALNNAEAQKRTIQESIQAKYTFLKQLMGYPSEKPLTISFDSSSYEKEILIDTLEILNYDKRIEYQSLQTSLKIQKAKIGYYRWSFLPSASVFYDYNLSYQNNQFSNLYLINYPNSLFGIKLSLSIFQGTNRLQNVRKAKFQYKRLELGSDYLKSQISTEYSQAIASYKSNLNELKIAETNIKVAREIYETVKLQYDNGIKAYLEVIVAETDLRTAELNYLNVLFYVLSSKLDLKKALGNVTVN